MSGDRRKFFTQKRHLKAQDQGSPGPDQSRYMCPEQEMLMLRIGTVASTKRLTRMVPTGDHKDLIKDKIQFCRIL